MRLIPLLLAALMALVFVAMPVIADDCNHAAVKAPIATPRLALHNGDGPGIQGGMSTTAITKLVNMILPAALEKVRQMPFEDISGRESGFDYEVRNIHIDRFNIENFDISVTDGVRVNLHGIYGKADMDWKYRLKKWPHLPKGSGSAEASMDVSDIGATFALSVSEDGRPVIQSYDVVVDINNIKIKTHGSIFSWLYNLILKAFKGTFKRAVEGALKTALETTFNEKIAEIIATLPMAAHVGQWGSIDLHIPQGGLGVVGQSIVLAFNGEVYPVGGGSDGETPRNDPQPFNPSGRLLDLVLDTFTLQSGFHTYHKAGLFNKVVDRENHMAGFPDLFHTANWTWFPNMEKTYFDHEVRFVAQFESEPRIVAEEGSLELAAGFRINVQVAPQGTDNWINAFNIIAVGGTNVNLSLDTAVEFHPIVHLSLGEFHPTFTTSDSTIGPVDLTMINIVIDALLNNVLLPGINVMISDGIPLPTVQGLSLSNAEFNVVKNGFAMHCDVDFNL